jgi:tRNA A-37 threonylcarbamoyl transferase component Bud32/tetratricopeptide (TPR) repeat protein
METDGPTRWIEGERDQDETRVDTSAPRERAAEPKELERGHRVGRYVVTDRIGSGGMGVVYSAFDPELDRQIALKVLSEDRFGSSGVDRSRERLLREAQALARLNHPNIVTVHDVGALDHDIFIAMDLIEGRTLKRWVREQRRSWREVLTVFVRAGSALAAAHDAEIVHRDFKPENVLLDDTGGVFVLDFGLARSTRRADRGHVRRNAAEELHRRAVSESSRRLVEHLTETGTVMGTPAYMAPEQHAGGSVDARADQFGYCVALYEALYGERPFPGETVDELVSSVMRHKLSPAPKRSDVPAWLRRLVLRGLSLDPGDRFPSMQALLRELERRPGLKRRRILLGVGIAGVLAAVGGANFHAEYTYAIQCTAGDTQVASVWNEQRREEIRTAFVDVGQSYATVVADSTTDALDEYTENWRNFRRESCEATQVHGEQSQQLFLVKESCFVQQFAQVEALTTVFARPDLDIVDHAVQATHELPALSRCRDMQPVGTRASVHERRDDQMREHIAVAAAWRDVGKRDAAKTLTAEALAYAQDSGHRDLEAQAKLIFAELRTEEGQVELAERDLYEAIWAAEAGAADHVAAQAWVRLTEVVAIDPERLDDARKLGRRADAAITRAGGDARLQAQLETELGSIAQRRERFDEALDHHRRALNLRRDNLGPTHLEVAQSLDHIGTIHRRQGQLELSVSEHLRALAVAEDALGPDHPSAAPYIEDLGDALMAQGKHIEARIHQDRARTILETAKHR